MNDEIDTIEFQANHDDELLGMISDLVGQANNNYLKALIASGKRDSDEVWKRYHEGFALDEDINSLALFRALSDLSNLSRFQKQQ